METILNTHHFITCCVHLHIDTNNISIYTPTVTIREHELIKSLIPLPKRLFLTIMSLVQKSNMIFLSVCSKPSSYDINIFFSRLSSSKSSKANIARKILIKLCLTIGSIHFSCVNPLTIILVLNLESSTLRMPLFFFNIHL